MRILLVPSSDYLGHPFPQRHNQIFERLARTHEVHVANFRIYGPPKRQSRTIVHDLPGRQMGSIAAYYGSNILAHSMKIREIIARYQIDVVVLSNLSAPFGYLLTKWDHRVVTIFYDMPDFFPTSASGFIAKKDSVTGLLTTGILRQMLHYCLKHSEMVTVASRALRRYVEVTENVRTTVVPNGISDAFLSATTQTSQRHWYGLDDGDIILGYVGSLEFWLDFDPVISAVRELRRRGLPVKVLVIGGGLQTDFAKVLSRKIKASSMDSAFVFTGFMDQDSVPSLIRMMDICLIPFDSSDPTAYFAGPNKLWEYLSQRRPVAATPIPEIIANQAYVNVVRGAVDYVKTVMDYAKSRESFVEKVNAGYEISRTMTWDNSAALYSQLLEQFKHR